MSAFSVTPLAPLDGLVDDVMGDLLGLSLLGGGLGDSLTGLFLGDLLDGGAGDDILNGAGGDDLLVGGLGDDQILGGSGTDTVSYLGAAGGMVVDLIAGTAEGDGSDVLDSVENVGGSNFDDIFESDLNGGALDGADGSDTVTYATVLNSITVDLEDGTVTSGSTSDTVQNVENLITGGGGDRLNGDGQANSLDGRGGDDTLNGRGGDDQLDGGEGSDTVTYADANSGVSVDLGKGKAGGGGGRDTLVGVENLIGTNFADVLRGDANTNRLQGLDGDDLIEGRGAGDALDGGAGRDMVSYAGASGGVTVNLSGGVAAGAAGPDSLASIEDAMGSAFADRLIGGAGANRLYGLDGADTLSGGVGADILNGGSGKDTVSYADAGGGVDASLATGRASGEGQDTLISIDNLTGGAFGDRFTGGQRGNGLSGGAGDDLLQGMGGNDRLDGGAGEDRLFGGSRYDELDGGAGADILDGGAHRDVLTGGAGNDTFRFTVIDGGVDRITDYAAGDVIDLSAIDADTGKGGNQAFHLVSQFGGHAGEVVMRYAANQDVTSVKLDVDGDGQADFTFRCDGDIRLVADFVF